MVQGVFYRHSTRHKAKANGVSGWVRNLDDGRVEAVLEGEPEAVKEVVRWCCMGPEGSRVDDIHIIWNEPVEWIKDFTII